MSANHYTPVASDKLSIRTKENTPQNFKRTGRKSAKQAQYLFEIHFSTLLTINLHTPIKQ